MSPSGTGRTISSFILTLFILLSILACKSFKQQDNELADTRERGTIRVSADESFKPIIDEQAKVYEANHPLAHIIVTYKPEADCLKDLFNDSIRMIIATRSPGKIEKEILVDSLDVSPESMVVARDAISVIVNNASDDTLLTMKDIVEILKGESNKSYIPVFDGLKATSTVRFIIDSVLHGDSLTSKAMAARSSEGVIDYVSQNQGVIGFLGVSWIGNPEDPAEVSYLKRVRMVYIESTDMPQVYVRPSQANIYIRRYPMVRDLVYIVKENYKGLGHGFADFMSGEIGQLIFRRAYLMPAQKNFGIRPVRLNEKTK